MLVSTASAWSRPSGSLVVRCSGHQESSSYRNNLRKGFAPVRQSKPKQPSKPSPVPGSQNGASTSGKKMVLGAEDFSMERWREVDKQMNKYPGTRSFTAIGMGTPEFKASMVQAVTSVVGEPLQPNQLSERPSSKGQYVSLTIGPVVVTSPEQVVEIFARMKSEGGSQLKWLM